MADNNNDSPWQVRAIATLGVTTVITLWAFYWLTQRIEPKVDDIHRLLGSHVIMEQQIQAQTESVIRILRASCVNQATTREDRERCFQ